MTAQHSSIPVSNFTFGNGWRPGSTRRVVVKEPDPTWNIARNDSFPLRRNDSSYTADGYDTGYTFRLNICGSLPEHPGDSTASEWRRGGHKGSLGKPNSKPHLRGDKLLLEYTDGDECPNNPRLRQSTLISFICDKDADGAGKPEFVAEWDQCAFIFEWRTVHACPVSRLEEDERGGGGDGSEDVSRGAVVFVAAFVVCSLYILGGFLYNRVLNSSRGLRGFEQLPNYDMWHAIFLFFRRISIYVADGVAHVGNAIAGRRGVIRIDSAEQDMRNELFDSGSESEGSAHALPFTSR
ncbi:Cation-independent mannose-6-phosphate receptor CI-MPR [Dipsacomyces acuminosporus]|nr:Cation-independent mannose-6-phosphate receptor CI-MPR [Dipsacomyces acuminosporus]